MINHLASQLALRAKLLTLADVATTGSTTLEATSTGYARASGSFLTDGFAPGMEVTPTGFTQTDTGVITGVTATTMAINGGRDVESSGAGRTLAVDLPSNRAWENVQFTPTMDEPWVREQYLPGPMNRITLGSLGELEVLPQYIVQVYVPEGYDITAAATYSDALLTLFAPDTSVTVSGATLRVRGDLAPFRGQALQSAPGYVVVPVTVPLRLRTANSI